jgi:hypothetical protein
VRNITNRSSIEHRNIYVDFKKLLNIGRGVENYFVSRPLSIYLYLEEKRPEKWSTVLAVVAHG